MEFPALFKLRVPGLALPAALGLWAALPGADPAAAANVQWSVGDSVVACPAGDTTNVAGHPSLLRVSVSYSDAGGQPRNLVPPESVWVNVSTQSGNVVVNDATQATVPADQWAIYASDSTRSGAARVTVVSLSGCGALRVTLWVSGVSQGSRTVTVRTVDTDAGGRVTAADQTGACDLNYDGVANDASLVSAHVDHWQRNALFGTLVQRTNLCEGCPSHSSPGNIGDGDLSWSPDGKYVAFSRRDSLGPSQFDVGTCVVYYVPSNPADGDTPRKFSFPDNQLHDYDPSWSPLGDVIVWDRDDQTIFRKGVPGINPDTTEHIILQADSVGLAYATTTSVSPDGKTVAFVGGINGLQRIFTVPITGGAPTQITLDASLTGQQWYPKWSPDGSTLVFWYDGTTRTLRTVPALANQNSTNFYAPTSTDAQDGSYSPDGKIIVGALGPFLQVVPNAMDAAMAGSPALIPYYTDYFGLGVPSPTYSPDGTRLALIAERPGVTGGYPQVWASRRNMNKPPVITSLAGSSLNAAAPVVDVTAPATNLLQFTVSAGDPEGDAITYVAYFLRKDLGMAFDSLTRTFTWTAPLNEIGNSYNVKFVASTASGGASYGIARITVGIPNDLVIQNQTFTGTSLEEANHSITAGPAVTVTNTANVTFHVVSSSGSITLGDGFWAQQGSTFRAYLANGAMGPARMQPWTQPDGTVRPVIAAAPEAERAAEPAAATATTPAAPLEFALAPNEPNPFRVETELRFSLPAPAQVRLEIFDPQGRRTRLLLQQTLPAGVHRVAWDRRDDSGARVAPGVYLYRLRAGARSALRKMVVLN